MNYRFTDTGAKPIKPRTCKSCTYYDIDTGMCIRTLQDIHPKSSACASYAFRDPRACDIIRWTVYDNATDDVLVACGTIDECCKRLEITPASFRVSVYRFKQCATEAEKMAQPYYFVRQVTNW